MAKKPKPATALAPTPQIVSATLGGNGEVVKVRPLTAQPAVAERQAGRDVVVCGGLLAANRTLARAIELAATGDEPKRCPPHANAGAHALPHYQPDPRPPDGHTFNETPNRQAF